MTLEQAFNIALPKWPQCLIFGEKIEEEQALEIIRRIDKFFSYSTIGNNKHFIEEAIKICKIPVIDDYIIKNKGDETYIDYDRYYDDRDKFYNDWGYIDLNYLNTDWISSCFIGGPNGWCAPDGTIRYEFNIGKYPSVDEVYDDLVTIATNFPYLNFTCILMSGEHCEEDIKPLVGFKIINKEVSLIDDLSSIDISAHNLNSQDIVKDFIKKIHYGNENYFSLEEIQKFADKVYK